MSENVGKYCISQEDFDLALAISDAVKNTEKHNEITSTGNAEVCVFSNELPYQDIFLKGKIDWINWEKKVILDLKTTSKTLDNGYIVRSIIKENMYNIQQAMYEMLLDHNGFSGFEFIFEFVETKPPHGVRFFKISSESALKSKQELDLKIALLQQCMLHNAWTSYSEELNVIDI